MQRAALHQHRRHRAAAAVQVRLDRHALGVLAGIGPQVELGVRGQHDRLEQAVQPGALPRRHVDEQRLAAEFLGHQAVLGELGAHPLRVGAFLVDLVDRDHDRHAGRLGVVERLGGLRLHPVVGGDHEHDQVGGLRAAGAHRGERLVARGVDERDLALLAVHLGGDLVGPDVLGDAARLPGHHVGVPDGIQQLGLAVVDVTHHGDHRRTRRQVGIVALVLAEVDVERLQQLLVLLLGGNHLHVVVELGAEKLQRLVVDRLGGGHQLAQVEEHLHQRGRVGVDLVGEVAQRRAAGQPDDLPVAARDRDAADGRRLQVVELLAPLLLRLAAAGRAPAGAAECSLGAAAATAARTCSAAAGPRAAAAQPAAAAAGRGADAGTGTTAGARAGTARGAAAAAAAATGAGRAAAAGAARPGPHVNRARPRAAGPRHVGGTGTPGPGTARARPARGLSRPAARLARARGPRLTGAALRRVRARAHAGRGRAERVVARPGPGPGDRARGRRPRRSRRCLARPRAAAGPEPGPGGVRPGAGAGAVPAAGSAAAGLAGARSATAGGAPAAAAGACAAAGGGGPGRGGRTAIRTRPVGAVLPRAAGFASCVPMDSLSLRTTGASIVEDAERTNSPISWSLAITALLSTPSSFASS